MLPALVFERSCLEPFQPGTARKQITNPDIKTFTTIPIHYLTKVVENSSRNPTEPTPFQVTFSSASRPCQRAVPSNIRSTPPRRYLLICPPPIHLYPNRLSSHSLCCVIHPYRETDRQTDSEEEDTLIE